MTSRLDGLGFSPYELLFGRRARLPVDSIIPIDSGVSRPVREYYQRLTDSITQIRDLFDYTQSKVDARMRYRRDRAQRRRPTEIRVGDYVFHSREYYNQDPAERGLRKLLGKFAGPSLVVEKLGVNTFRVQVDEKTIKTFNVEHLAPYKGEFLPLYRPQPSSSLSGLRIGEDDRDDSKSTELEWKENRSEIPEAILPPPESGELGLQGVATLVETKIDLEMPRSSAATVSNRPKRVRERERVSEESKRPLKRARGSEDFEFMDSDSKEGDRDIATSSSVGQWTLAIEKRLLDRNKKSLFLGKVIEKVMKDGIEVDTVHVWKPRGIHKERVFLPHWFRMHEDEINYDLATTDSILPDSWQPWLVDLDGKFIVVRKSALREQVRKPPERLVHLYNQVWDDKIRERSLMKEIPSSDSVSANRIDPDPMVSSDSALRRSTRERKAKSKD